MAVKSGSGGQLDGKIYEITNLINGKRYFGQTIQNPFKRWNHHKCCSRKNIKHPLYDSMRKYSVEKFQFKVIIDNISTKSELDRLEKIWIHICHTTEREFGYNLESGGSLNKLGYVDPVLILLNLK